LDKYNLLFNIEPYDLIYNKFKDYFLKTWKFYYEDGTLNYIFINKKQRCNSYLENYNKRIKNILWQFLLQKGRTIIPLPLFITFSKNKEFYYNILIKDFLSKDIIHDKNNFIEKTISIDNKNIINNIKNNDKIFWLGYNKLSCCYDSFTLLFFSTIYSILTSNFTNVYSNNISDLIKLLYIIVNSIENHHNKSFWNIVSDNPKYSLNILNINNGFQEEFHIHNLFNWFAGDKFFVISYNCVKMCQLYFYFENKIEETNPFFSIDLIEINSLKKFTEVLYSKFKSNKSACPNCSYEGLDFDKDLKKDLIYHSCLTSNYSNLILPQILIFSFELSNENEGDEARFKNLIKYRNNILSMIEEKFVFINVTFNLLGIICQPNINHYTSYCHNCQTTKLNLLLNNSYYYDDMFNKGEIINIKENDFNKKFVIISSYNPFIIIYGKIN
jgi:hypothetical protein